MIGLVVVGNRIIGRRPSSNGTGVQSTIRIRSRKDLVTPLTILLLPNYNIKYHQEKYTIGYKNPCDPPGDDMDGGTNET